ncbi:MAG TPA: hypothetical protein VIV40_43230 [Kofleriaceae bacterium]
MPAKFSILAATAFPLCTVALACGGDDGGGGIHVVDAAMGSGSGSGQKDAAAVTCYVDSMYAPTFGSADQFAQTAGSGASGSNAHTEIWGGALNMDMTPDVLQVELYAGFAAFNGTDIMPKTIQLSGDELNYKTCGACVRIFADSTQDNSAAQYFATAGTVTLSSVQGTLMGTLSNITLTKVTVADDYTSTPVGDGCTTTITSATMNAMLQMGSGSGSATGPTPLAREATPNRLVLTQRHY